MTVDVDFYSRRLREELHLADIATTPRDRQLHTKRADDYGRELRRGSAKDAPEAIAQWKLRRRSEVFGDWLADVL